MKYSIIGSLPVEGGDAIEIVDAINAFPLWRLVVTVAGGEFGFEVWVAEVSDRVQLFDDLKWYVDTHGGSISWHVCTHDEEISQPCVIAETYEGGV